MSGYRCVDPEGDWIRDQQATVPYLEDADFTLYLGDVADVLPRLPDGSVHCVVTSPPYWGLRDYGTEGQLGLESTPDAYVARMVEVFREVRRVLRADGTCWLNLGDSYGSGTSADRNPTSTEGPDVPASWSNRSQAPRNGLKPKDLVGIPWRLALALQADGWYLRCDIIWSKPNPMPESVTDRPTKAHEYLFLLTKSAQYFYDADAIREPAEYGRRVYSEGWRSGAENGDGHRSGGGSVTGGDPSAGRNRRSVWEIPTEAYPDAHFATFPQALVEPCIKAGCPEGGTVLDPFLGSGTTALVARRLGRRSIGIELSPEYADLAARRLQQLSLLTGGTL